MAYVRARSEINQMSAKRKAGLEAEGRLVFGSTFARPVGKKPAPAPVNTNPSEEVVQLVLKRALRWTEHGLVLCCEVCGVEEPLTGQRGWDWSLHHIRGRDGERTDNSPSNLVLVSGRDNVTGCHGRIHQDRTWAKEHGLWLPRNGVQVPSSHNPVLVDSGSRWVYLGAGEYHDAPPPVRDRPLIAALPLFEEGTP